MRWEQPVQYASLSDIGFRRRMNQDTFAIQICSEQTVWRAHGHLFLVADGMGGHAVGELASKIAADTIPHTFYKSRDRDCSAALRESIEAANAAIYERGRLNRDFERMGTTCVALALGPYGAVIGHVGDSRVYRVRGDRIDQLTFDHSLQWELLRQGRMKPEDIFLNEPRHVITRSLGPEPKVRVDIDGPYPAQADDVFLLCSDGLTGHVKDEEIGAVIGALPPADAVRLLVNLANLRGGSDNITVVVVRIGTAPEGVGVADTGELPLEGKGMAWLWLALFWSVGAALTAGIAIGLLGYVQSGIYLAFSALSALVLLVAYWRSLHRAPRPVSGDSDQTVLWSPYRTASARLGRSLLAHLATVESELFRTSEEERWTIDRAARETALEEAKVALARRDDRSALRNFAKAIDAMMAGLTAQRRKVRRVTPRQRPGGRTPTEG